MRILLIEDDEDLLDSLKAGFKTQGFAVSAANNGIEGINSAINDKPDLIISDYNLPDKNGDEVCQVIRKSGLSTPILMLTVNTEIENKVKLLDIGADDYMTKPFQFSELLARIKALLRRPKSIADEILRIENIVIDMNKQLVRISGKKIQLTLKEFRILEYLLRHKEEAVSKTALIENIWDREDSLFSKSLETHILNLRKKIGKDRIQTIPCRGYRIK